jgi:NADH dehydrogenase FAD-containing subunit
VYIYDIGAVGIEMAAELKLVQPAIDVTLVHSRDKLLSSEPLPDDAKDCALQLVKEANVKVLLSHRVAKTEDSTYDNDGSKCIKLTFTNGHSMLASEVIWAISHSVPSTNFLPEDALDEQGYVKIHAKYGVSWLLKQLSTHANMFAVLLSQLKFLMRQITSQLVTWSSGLGSSVAALQCTWDTMSPTTFTSS